MVLGVLLFAMAGASFMASGIALGQFSAARGLLRGGDMPNGGPIVFEIPCSCSGGHVIQVGPPRPGRLLVQPGITRVYKFYRPHVGSWDLGLAFPGGQCLVPNPVDGCHSVPVDGTQLIMGTSLTL